jgi:hypothetical protein
MLLVSTPSLSAIVMGSRFWTRELEEKPERVPLQILKFGVDRKPGTIIYSPCPLLQIMVALKHHSRTGHQRNFPQ